MEFIAKAEWGAPETLQDFWKDQTWKASRKPGLLVKLRLLGCGQPTLRSTSLHSATKPCQWDSRGRWTGAEYHLGMAKARRSLTTIKTWRIGPDWGWAPPKGDTGCHSASQISCCQILVLPAAPHFEKMELITLKIYVIKKPKGSTDKCLDVTHREWKWSRKTRKVKELPNPSLRNWMFLKSVY